MNSANSKKGIILNKLNSSLKGRKENYTHESKFIKEVKKSHRKRDELQDVIPLLYMNGLFSRKVKKSVLKLMGKNGLGYQNILRITGKIFA